MPPCASRASRDGPEVWVVRLRLVEQGVHLELGHVRQKQRVRYEKMEESVVGRERSIAGLRAGTSDLQPKTDVLGPSRRSPSLADTLQACSGHPSGRYLARPGDSPSLCPCSDATRPPLTPSTRPLLLPLNRRRARSSPRRARTSSPSTPTPLSARWRREFGSLLGYSWGA